MKSAVFSVSRYGLHRPARGVLAGALAVACFASGCDVPADADTEVGGLSVSPTREYYVGHFVRRESRGTCEPSCAQWETIMVPPPPKPGQPDDLPPVNRRVCKKYNRDCSYLSKNVLFGAPGGADHFSAIPDFPDDPRLGTLYLGCGPKAAQNVLAYFGVQRPIHGIPSPPYYVKTMRTDAWSLHFQKGIATLPDELANGLRRALAELGDGQFTVVRKQVDDVMDEVKKSINAGFPIIVQVENGSHFVVVTGFDVKADYKLWINDYTYDDGTIQPAREVKYSDLNFGVPLAATLLGYPGNWRANTVITIERAPAAAKNGLYKASDAGTVYSLNGNKACHLTWEQFVALGQPGYTTISPAQGKNFRSSYYRGDLCNNGEAGLPNWNDGLYKASDNATVYQLRGARACAVTWPQYVAMGQPGFTVMSPADMGRFKAAFGGDSYCPN